MFLEVPSILVNERRQLALGYEAVAHGRLRDDEFWLGRIVFDLFAQVGDMDAEVMCLLDGLRPPNLRVKLAMC